MALPALIKGAKQVPKVLKIARKIPGIRLSKNRQVRKLMISKGLQAGQRGTKVVGESPRIPGKTFKHFPGERGEAYLKEAYSHFAKHGNMKGFKKGLTDTGEQVFPRPTLNLKSVDPIKMKGLKADRVSDRTASAARRATRTAIPEEEVAKLAKKYNQPDSVIKGFLAEQKTAKKNLDDLVKKLNKRIKANPEFYGKEFKASLGHGRAAEKYQHSADIASNIELEEFFKNVQRSNKDEISDLFNQGLGRSLDLEEEFLKYISPTLKDFWPKLNRKVKDTIIASVRRKMADPNIIWKHQAANGKQLFRSKEEYLINEALQKHMK